MTPLLSLIAPTYCERENIRPFCRALTAALGDQPWELIFVDDDSPDGTYDEIRAVAREGAPVRGIRRVGRRGLASAVVEGVMSARGEIVGILDADLQHDETLLLPMRDILLTTSADVVVGSRHVDGGGLGDCSPSRRRMSALAAKASRALIGNQLTDPMSGFFMTRRRVFDQVIYSLSQQGYKILLDLLTSAPRPLKVVELPYVFRDRRYGHSKVDTMIVLEYAFLLIEKLTGGIVPPRFVLFAAVSLTGLSAHLTVLALATRFGLSFLRAQVAATIAAMAFNYIFNNLITYRTERLRGAAFFTGFVIFCAICSVGSVANISFAKVAMREVHSWPIAGVAGAIVSLVFNFGVATQFVWGRLRRPRRTGGEPPSARLGLSVSAWLLGRHGQAAPMQDPSR